MLFCSVWKTDIVFEERSFGETWPSLNKSCTDIRIYFKTLKVLRWLRKEIYTLETPPSTPYDQCNVKLYHYIIWVSTHLIRLIQVELYMLMLVDCWSWEGDKYINRFKLKQVCLRSLVTVQSSSGILLYFWFDILIFKKCCYSLLRKKFIISFCKAFF